MQQEESEKSTEDLPPVWENGPVLFWLLDMLIALVCAVLGGSFGWGLTQLHSYVTERRVPNDSDYSILPAVALVACVTALLPAGLIRTAMGPIKHRKTWAVSWLIFGTIFGPVVSILLIAFAMSGRPY